MYYQQMQNFNPQSMGQQSMQSYLSMMGQQGMQGMQQQQNQNMIKNPQSGLLPKVKGPQVNDRDSVNAALAQAKYITDNFNVFAREASHRQLHNDVMRILNETHAMTRELFDLMFRKGWYSLETEQPQKLAQSHQNFTQYSSQFPYAINMQ